MSIKNIYIDSNACICCDLCVDLCPSLFTSQECVPIPTQEDVTYKQCAFDAVDFCPTAAITIK